MLILLLLLSVILAFLHFAKNIYEMESIDSAYYEYYSKNPHKVMYLLTMSITLLVLIPVTEFILVTNETQIPEPLTLTEQRRLQEEIRILNVSIKMAEVTHLTSFITVLEDIRKSKEDFLSGKTRSTLKKSYMLERKLLLFKLPRVHLIVLYIILFSMTAFVFWIDNTYM